MPTCSYLVYPTKNCYQKLVETLMKIPNCVTVPASNEDVLILITETSSDHEEAELQKQLKNVNEIECLALTFGTVET